MVNKKGNNMLKFYEIQHPNPNLNDTIKKLQDLTQSNDITITKEGLHQLTELILTEFAHQYRKGWDDAETNIEMMIG